MVYFKSVMFARIDLVTNVKPDLGSMFDCIHIKSFPIFYCRYVKITITCI